MSDQTIALQLNIDTNAPDAIDQIKVKIEELQEKLSSISENTKEYTDALGSLGNAKNLLDQLNSTISIQNGLSESMTVQFSKFGDTASEALKGIGVAATLASQNNLDLANIIDRATTSAANAGNQKLITLQKENVEILKESEDFEKSNSDIKTKYQAIELAGQEQSSQEKKRILDAEFTSAKSGADALISLADLMIENGKKNTDAQKATALIQIGINTAKAISSLVAASNENPANAATSGVAGIVQFAAGIAEILANVAKAKDILDGSSIGGSASSVQALNAVSSNINTAAPDLSKPGQSSSVSINRATLSNTRQQGTIKAYVVESEITNSQKRAATLKNQSFH